MRPVCKKHDARVHFHAQMTPQMSSEHPQWHVGSLQVGTLQCAQALSCVLAFDRGRRYMMVTQKLRRTCIFNWGKSCRWFRYNRYYAVLHRNETLRIGDVLYN